MSIFAPFVNGQFQTADASAQSVNNASKDKNTSGMDSDAFLQLLVAEMQNQDPLEPTSNTDWIAQYATFTQVSEIQSIGDDMTNMKAQGLVGQYVMMKVKNEEGNTDIISGRVDYVTYENKKAFLNIDGKPYSIDDLDTVADEKYMVAYNKASDLAKVFNKLPKLANVTIGDRTKIEEVAEMASSMDDYQKTFLTKEVFEKIEEYVNRLKELIGKETTEEVEEKNEEIEKTEESTDAEAADKEVNVI